MDDLVLLLKGGVASYTLSVAAEEALRTINMNEDHLEKLQEIVEVTGLPCLIALLSGLGLGQVILYITCGISIGSGVMNLVMGNIVRPEVENGFTGLALVLGCGIAGAVLGSTFFAILIRGLKGLCFMGLMLSLSLFITTRTQAEIRNICSLLALTFMTMLLGVCLGMKMAGMDVIDPGKAVIPTLFFTCIFLIPGVCLVGFLAEVALRDPNLLRGLSLMFSVLVAVAGFTNGLAVGDHTVGLSYFTFKLVHSLVYNAALFAGVAGSYLGAMSLVSLQTDSAGRLSFQISILTALILYHIQDLPGPLFSDGPFKVGSALGSLLGIAGVSGVAVGAAGVSVEPMLLWKFLALAFGALCGFFLRGPVTFSNLITSLSLALCPMLVKASTQNTARHGDKMTPVFEAAAKLGMVLIGATVLGAAGVLTAGLGSAGYYVVGLVQLIIIVTGFTICFEHDQ